MHQYDSLQLALFSGKGGVGKTTLSCAFARSWAKQFPEQSILLVSTDPAHSLGDVLQVPVSNTAQVVDDSPNLQVRSLDAAALLQDFKARYGKVLELLVERGSFVSGEDLTPVWDLSWPGLDELMAILEIQRLLQAGEAVRVVVDMAPSGHTLNLFKLMDFLDELLAALELFQEKHRVISARFAGRYTEDEADEFLQTMHTELVTGRQLLQDANRTACLVVAIAEPMSLAETQRFLNSLAQLQIPCGGLWVNQLVSAEESSDRAHEQQTVLPQFQTLCSNKPLWLVPRQTHEPVGMAALDHLLSQVQPLTISPVVADFTVQWPTKATSSFSDFLAEGRQLLLVGGKGGVGKTTVAAAIAWHLAEQHRDRQVRVISIDPAHSLGDAFGQTLGHQPIALTANLTGQEIDAHQILDQFRQEYLWELAEMMSGESQEGDRSLIIAYGPEAWRRIAAQALPGIDEMLSLLTVMELLEKQEQDLIILDTAPTGHLLRFLEMPTALADWLAWIFKLWIKYQDAIGHTEFMGRLRTLRQRVIQAQKRLRDPKLTEFILVLQAQAAIVAEAQRLTETLTTMQVPQRYLVQNRWASDRELPAEKFPDHTIIRLPELPRSVTPQARIAGAAQLLF
jgi:arsenite/tail-anchored protein-transporting ATPase